MNLLASIIDAVFPPKCIVCDSILNNERGPICPDCNSRINWIYSGYFNAELRTRHFNSARSLAAYDGAWAQVIHNFKYNDRTDLAKPLARLMSGVVDYEYDLIVPVPLHIKRLRERGYNQSVLLVRELSKMTGFKADIGCLKRPKKTKDQVGLSKSERMENVKGAFEYCGRSPGLKGQADATCPGPDVLLIDDVITTGATVNECAAVLKKSGAGRVDVLTLAKAGVRTS